MMACIACLLAVLSVLFCQSFDPDKVLFANDGALGVLAMKVPRWSWLRFVLAGLAIGMGVIEGADVGAIFSILLAFFVLYSALTGEGSSVARKIAIAVRDLTIIALFAGFIAAQT